MSKVIRTESISKSSISLSVIHNRNALMTSRLLKNLSNRTVL